MPRNASGVYSPPSGTLAVTNTAISSTKYNEFVNDLASALTGSVPRNGSAGMQANLPMGGFKITGLAAGTAAGDALRFEQFFPSGTLMLFQQSTAPVGWTKQTTHDNKALRVVSGTAGSGGTTAFTTVFAARTISAANLPAHTHGPGTLGGTTSSNGDHNHDYTRTNDGNTTRAGGGGTCNDGDFLDNTTTDGAHTHTITLSTGVSGSTGSGTAMDFAVAYVDLIIAAKD